MKLKKDQIKILIIILFVLLIVGLLLIVVISGNKDKGTFIKYKDFYSLLDEGKIEIVSLDTDYVYYERDGEKFYTNNPKSDSFREELLKKDVYVEDTFDDEDLNLIYDIIFNIMFFGMIIGIITVLVGYKIKNGFRVVRHTGVKFSDVAGLDDLKEDLMQVVDILNNPSKFTSKGIRPPRGIILEGPPGNGKTLLAKALAEEANINFIATRGADFQSAFMSMGSRKIKDLFRTALRHKPCIVFIDEFDGIAERRNYAGTGVDKENNRIITSMLSEMDGFNSKDGVLIIGATNSYNSLEPALIRPGRFDIKYTVPNPDLETRIKLIEIYTKKRQVDESIPKENLANAFETLSSSAVETILNEAQMLATLNNHDKILEDDLILASNKTNLPINISKLRRKK